MIFLLGLITTQTGVMYAMRLTDIYGKNRYAIMVFTYVTCTILSFFLLSDKTLFYNTHAGRTAFCLALYNGPLMVAGLYYITYSIRTNGTPISTTFNRLGILIPTGVSILIFRESPGSIQLVGILIAVFSIIYINSGKEKREHNHVKSMPLLFGIFFIGGLIDLNSKLYDVYGDNTLKDHYTFYTFAICIAASLLTALAKDRSVHWNDILIGILIGVPNAFTLSLTLKAVELLPAYIVFPAASAGVILIVNLINYFILHEGLSRQEKIATGLIAIALVMINL
ncbi:EamA family transporter [Hornefia butyriciproducens]|uniref:EamA family transporter n=1 Tax=Hornefia butyriciproducens TaxID=2652293 RepID=UPI002A90A12D|nr:EamA family transporter [Hornefia butyriciproducens]MDY5422717.1 EamA family transporter [Hornefia butyriciproducens]